MRLHDTIRTVLWLTIAAALSTGTGCSAAHQQAVDPLPVLSDIQSMEFSLGDARQINFKVPESNWEAIFNCLRPSRRDDSPMKWVVLGELRIVCKSAPPFMVFLFKTSDGPGAFAAGEFWDSRSLFSRGRFAKTETSTRRRAPRIGFAEYAKH